MHDPDNLFRHTVDGLTPGTSYTFKVQAQNMVGLGPGVEVTILAAGKPGAPENLANDAAITASGTVGITWSAPSSNGGSSIIDYQISYRTD